MSLLRLLASIGLVSILTNSNQAGSLAPPPGPVQATMKTLQEMEPRIPLSQATAPGDADSVFHITQSGSYYLTEDLIGEAGKHGIKIAVHLNVRLDGRGFTLVGAPGSLDGIRVISNSQGPGWCWSDHLTIHGWDGAGIAGPGHCNMDIRDTFIYDCGVGVDAGDRSFIARVMVSTIASDGIRAADNTMLMECSAMDTGGHGIVLGNGCVATNTVTLLTGGDGVFVDGPNVTVESCSISGASGNGIYVVWTNFAARGCSISAVQLDGLRITADRFTVRESVIEGSSGVGLSLSGGNGLIEGCRVSTEAGSGSILSTGDGNTFRNCEVYSSGLNTVSDIVLGPRNSILDFVCIQDNSTYSGPAIDASADDILMHRVTQRATNVVATSLVRGGNFVDGLDYLEWASAVTCTNSVVNFPGGLSSLDDLDIVLNNVSAPDIVRLGGRASTLTGAGIRGIPAASVGIRVAGNRCEVRDCSLAGAIASMHTGIAVDSNDCIVFGNTMSALQGGQPIANAGMNNLIGPVIDSQSFQGVCDSCANVAH